MTYGENPWQVLLVHSGLMSVRVIYSFPGAEAALVSTKELWFHTRGTRFATAQNTVPIASGTFGIAPSEIDYRTVPTSMLNPPNFRVLKWQLSANF